MSLILWNPPSILGPNTFLRTDNMDDGMCNIAAKFSTSSNHKWTAGTSQYPEIYINCNTNIVVHFHVAAQSYESTFS